MIDTSDLTRFIGELERSPEGIRKGSRAAVEKSSSAIRDDMRERMRASRHFKQVASSISRSVVAGGMGAEIGPTKGGAGSLANVAYFGTSRGGGTVEEPAMALHREIPAFERAMQLVARIGT